MALSTALLCAPALARPPSLVVLPFSQGQGSPPRAAAAFTELLAEELRRRDELAVVPAAELPEELRAIPPAVAALQAGLATYRERRFAEAAAQLDRALQLLRADPCAAEASSLQSALFTLAAAWWRAGDEAAARVALADWARLAPSASLPEDLAPRFEREASRARARAARAQGTLTVQGPRSAVASIDGRLAGQVPVVQALPAGRHLVCVEGAAGARFAQSAEVKAGRTTTVKARVGQASRAAQLVPGDSLDAPALERLVSLARASTADWAVAGVVYRISDSQLRAGAVLVESATGLAYALPAVAFDADVLTARPEIYRLAEVVQARVARHPAAAALPLRLVEGAIGADTPAVAPDDRPADVVAAAPASSTEGASAPSAFVERSVEPPPPDQGVSPVAAALLVSLGMAVLAGAGVGVYLLATSSSRPVSGTVSATWPAP